MKASTSGISAFSSSRYLSTRQPATTSRLALPSVFNRAASRIASIDSRQQTLNLHPLRFRQLLVSESQAIVSNCDHLRFAHASRRRKFQRSLVQLAFDASLLKSL